MKKVCFSLLICLAATAAMAQNLQNASKQLKVFNQLYKTLDMYYVDTLDAEKNITTAINAMLYDLDPYTEYYTAKTARELNTMTTGKYAGVGMLIHYYKAEDRCVAYQLFEDKPAQKAGIKVGDVILSIDGKEMGPKGSKPVNDFTNSVSSALRGDPNTVAHVRVKRLTDTLDIDITRASVQLPAMPYSGLVDGDVGYIYLSSFTTDCSDDVRQAVRNLKEQGAKSIVLDLRNNGGGLANEAVKIVNIFVEKGKLILKMKGKVAAANTSYATQGIPEDLDIPLAVLVNGASASSSEIVCGSLQDLDRAVIVGERTFGKGLVQQPHELPYDGVLKLTTSHYYIPSGRCIQALDYSHRTDNGEAYRTPDSLTHTFYTEAGRPVKDGGGITPDITVSDTIPALLAYLRNSDEYFDWLNAYCRSHETISPAGEFGISDEDYEAFTDSIVKSGFTPENRSKRVVEQLRKILKAEDASEEAMQNLSTLEESLKPDLAKILAQHKDKMSRCINADICDRYYYSAGAQQNALLHDVQLDAAVAVLKDSKRYKEILGQ